MDLLQVECVIGSCSRTGNSLERTSARWSKDICGPSPLHAEPATRQSDLTPELPSESNLCALPEGREGGSSECQRRVLMIAGGGSAPPCLAKLVQ